MVHPVIVLTGLTTSHYPLSIFYDRLIVQYSPMVYLNFFLGCYRIWATDCSYSNETPPKQKTFYDKIEYNK